MTEKTSCGTVRRLWAECYDSEMGRFLLAPIEELSCNSCPIGKAAKKPVRLSIILKKLRDLKNEIRRRVWLLALRSIEAGYLGTNTPSASKIVDHVLELRDALQ